MSKSTTLLAATDLKKTPKNSIQVLSEAQKVVSIIFSK